MTILARKLGIAAPLSPSDLDALDRAVTRIRQVRPHAVLIDDGDRPEVVHVVLDGFACRYKLLPDGGKQIMAWLVPGDFCDLQVAVLGEMDHTVATVSASRIGSISRDDVLRLGRESEALSRALLWAALVQEAILREWLVNMGRRDAEARAMHLICELHARLTAIGLVEDDTFAFPVSQTEFADTLGISPVHLNRVIQSLRDKDLIHWSQKRLAIHDLPRLRELAGFTPSYLHLSRRPPSQAADAPALPHLAGASHAG